MPGASKGWSIARATGFYWLLDRMLAKTARRRTLWLPADIHMQAVDSDEFAPFVVDVLNDAGRGEQPDFVGPQTLTMRELAGQYLAERRLERRVRSAPMPRRIEHALDVGNTSSTGIRAERTWQDWLRLHPAAAVARDGVPLRTPRERGGSVSLIVKPGLDLGAAHMATSRWR
jgi:hypothetical protein